MPDLKSRCKKTEILFIWLYCQNSNKTIIQAVIISRERLAGGVIERMSGTAGVLQERWTTQNCHQSLKKKKNPNPSKKWTWRLNHKITNQKWLLFESKPPKAIVCAQTHLDHPHWLALEHRIQLVFKGVWLGWKSGVPHFQYHCRLATYSARLSLCLEKKPPKGRGRKCLRKNHL